MQVLVLIRTCSSNESSEIKNKPAGQSSEGNTLAGSSAKTDSPYVWSDIQLQSFTEKTVHSSNSVVNANPYQDVIDNLIQLTRVNDYLKSRDILERVPTVDITALYRNNLPIIRYLIEQVSIITIPTDVFQPNHADRICPF